MPRGSKPGERRGGRQRATPNRRTVLTNRILAAAAANPAPTTNELVLVLAKDQDLPADTRMAIARKALLFDPSRSMHSRAAAPNGHSRPPSEPGTKIGPDDEANKGSAPKRGGAIAAKAGLATDLLLLWRRIPLRLLPIVARPPRKSPDFFCQRTLEERNHVAANSLLMNTVLLSTRNSQRNCATAH